MAGTEQGKRRRFADATNRSKITSATQAIYHNYRVHDGHMIDLLSSWLE